MGRYHSDINRIMTLIYGDQPIAKRQAEPSVFVPERIKAIRSMGRGAAARCQGRVIVFLHQARIMADYEDDYEYTKDFYSFQPVYESLSDEQLRGYFGFRSRLRRGKVQKAPRAFAYLYLYELINLVGVSSPWEGLYKLTEFIKLYGPLDSEVALQAEQWTVDFILYYKLDPKLLEGMRFIKYDHMLKMLMEDKDAYQAMLYLSGLGKKSLPSYKDNPEFFERTCELAYRGMRSYFETHRKHSLLETYVGAQINKPVKLFYGAVFAGDFLTNDCFDVQVSELTVYHCERGRWAIKTYPREYKNQNFAKLLLAIDLILRGEDASEIQPKWAVKIIQNAAAETDKELKEEEARKVDIDFSSLAGIRREASITMEKLITEDDLEFEEEPVTEAEIPLGLTDKEMDFITALLKGEEPQTDGLMSVIVDSINDKLFEEIGDVVIEDGNPPVLVEDYREEIESLLAVSI